MTTFIGIDPGASGAVAVISGRKVSLHKVPKTESEVWELLRPFKVPDVRSPRDTGPYVLVAVEKVGGYVGGGHARGSHMFTFGLGVGLLRMAVVACGLDLTEVTPQRWQKDLGVSPRVKSSKGRRGETDSAWKGRLAGHARSLFPQAAIYQYAADALLIAEWLRRKHEGGG